MQNLEERFLELCDLQSEKISKFLNEKDIQHNVLNAKQHEKEAKIICKAWEDHPDHTILKAMVLERSIFFTILPFFRAFGDAGLRSTSADISRDEQIHVATNSLVCTELNLTWSPSLDKLRKATVSWLYEDLQHEKNLSKKFWQESSDRLMYQGKAPELSFTKAARMPAFFEHNNVNLPQYA